VPRTWPGCAASSTELSPPAADVINMGLLARLQPRDADLAARVLATLALVAGGVTVVFAAVQPGEQGATPVSLLLTVVSVAAVVAVALLLRRMRTSSAWVWALFPFAAIGVIVFLDLFTSDATASAQVFFLFPALYGGALQYVNNYVASDGTVGPAAFAARAEQLAAYGSRFRGFSEWAAALKPRPSCGTRWRRVICR